MCNANGECCINELRLGYNVPAYRVGVVVDDDDNDNVAVVV